VRRDLTAVPASERGPVETATLAGIGAIALVAQHADELASEIATRIGVERDEVRAVIADVVDSWRREAVRLGESGGSMAAKAASELGAASRDAVSDLELRVAQIEHRLKLLERDAT
jgi:polyhydroxyalkanoate synthesis regulator phasin